MQVTEYAELHSNDSEGRAFFLLALEEHRIDLEIEYITAMESKGDRMWHEVDNPSEIPELEKRGWKITEFVDNVFNDIRIVAYK